MSPASEGDDEIRLSFFNNRIKHEETQPVTEVIRRLPARQLPLPSNWFCLCDCRDCLVNLVNSTSLFSGTCKFYFFPESSGSSLQEGICQFRIVLLLGRNWPHSFKKVSSVKFDVLIGRALRNLLRAGRP